MSERLGTLHALQPPPKAAPARHHRQRRHPAHPHAVPHPAARRPPRPRRADRPRQADNLLQANGYVRLDTVNDAGEFAVRGGLVDLFPSGAEQALRLDFFGDEIESVRTFSPEDQRTTGRVDGFTLLPASETLLDEESIKRFRSRYREKFGANATGDPLYQAISDGRRLAGMEHWLPLFEERLETLFDHLPDDAVIVRDSATAGAGEQRFEAIADYQQNRVRAESSAPGSYRPLAADALYLGADEWSAKRLDRRPGPHRHAVPRARSATVLDFNVDGPRDFAPERAAGTNVYEAVVRASRQGYGRTGKADPRQLFERRARATAGPARRSRPEGRRPADGWQEALGCRDKGVALIVLPLDHGFTAPDVAVLTEQDMLGDRLIRRTKRRKNTDAFLQELATLSPGDLVVPCRARHRPL
jgi:transcription-repair coupling factor (superfamily II helicase)